MSARTRNAAGAKAPVDMPRERACPFDPPEGYDRLAAYGKPTTSLVLSTVAEHRPIPDIA